MTVPAVGARPQIADVSTGDITRVDFRIDTGPVVMTMPDGAVMHAEIMIGDS